MEFLKDKNQLDEIIQPKKKKCFDGDIQNKENLNVPSVDINKINSMILKSLINMFGELTTRNNLLHEILKDNFLKYFDLAVRSFIDLVKYYISKQYTKFIGFHIQLKLTYEAIIKCIETFNHIINYEILQNEEAIFKNDKICGVLENISKDIFMIFTAQPYRSFCFATGFNYQIKDIFDVLIRLELKVCSVPKKFKQFSKIGTQLYNWRMITIHLRFIEHKFSTLSTEDSDKNIKKYSSYVENFDAILEKYAFSVGQYNS